MTPRGLADWIGLAAGVAVFANLGWDGPLWDARSQLLLHLVAIGAVLGLGLMALRGQELPRTPLDLPILGLLAAFAIATWSALNVGMSLRAMAAIVAFAAMLPVALVAVRRRPVWVGLVTSVPVLLLSVPTLVEFLARRVEWIAVGAPGLPPLRLPSEGTPFGSVAVPPFVLIPAWTLAGLIEPPWLRRAVRVGLAVVGIPLIILSGSRSAWLAIAAGFAIGVLPWAWERRHRLRRPRRLSARGVLLGLGSVAIAGIGLVLVVPRLTAVTSLIYRGALWRDTLVAWSSDPLLGIGPGFMPYARQAAAADFSFPVRQPHSHNLPLGVLGDAGVVGLAAGLIVVGTTVLFAGPWRSRTSLGRMASVVLIGLGVGGLFEDLTFLPGFNLLAISLVAVALLEAGAVNWGAIRLPPGLRRAALLAGSGIVATVLVGAMVVADAGAIAYRAGIRAAESTDWAGSATWLARAAEIDPWHPAGARALAVAADAAGRPGLALDAAEQATLLNPGDATAWTNLALLCEADGNDECASHAAERAAATARYLAPELLNAAIVFERLGQPDAADDAYRRSLLTQPATSFVVDWPRSVDIGDGRIADVTDPSWQLNLLLARHSTGEPIDPDDYADESIRALAYAANDDRDDAELWLERGLAEHPEDIRTPDIAVILRDAWGEPTEQSISIAEVVRGRPFPDREPGAGPRSVRDVGSLRTYPADGFVTSAMRMTTRPAFPWALQLILP
jgi:tetratricopeptide (TPR) repeat protein